MSIQTFYNDWSGNSDRTPFIQRRRRHSGGMTLHGFAEGLVGYTRWRKTIRSHADRGCPATKKWYTFFYKSKVIIANQVRAYASSLAFSLSNSVPASWMSERARTAVRACNSDWSRNPDTLIAWHRISLRRLEYGNVKLHVLHFIFPTACARSMV